MEVLFLLLEFCIRLVVLLPACGVILDLRIYDNDDVRRPFHCLAKQSTSGVWANIAKVKNAIHKLGIEQSDILWSNDDGASWNSEFVLDGFFHVAKFRNRLDRATHPISDREFWWLELGF
ncbi:hypothetical protein L2E82_40499 [Cichorium intybus]|uniref:Uncharacterized protein n=1 Tax=Cichorium intybus TaxID=13427 RepID=A0ACB9AQK6_CICIN|nr:hypothetical protein L2E82_40499 [Cichorium intybus]